MKKSMNQSTLAILLNSLSIAFVIVTIIFIVNAMALNEAVDNTFLAMLDASAENEANALMVQTHHMEILAFVFVLIVAGLQLINVFAVMRFTILPIKKLQKEMAEIAKGNLSSDLSLTPDTSEIGRLTASVIEIKEQLALYIFDISDKLQHMAEGNLTIDVDIDYIGDYAPIKSSLITILDSLNDTLSQISDASLAVSQASKQVAYGAHSLAQGSTEQAASIEVLTGAVADINRMAKENSDLTTEAKNEVVEAGQLMGTCIDQMAQTLAAMQTIDEKSKNILNTTKVVDDIAFQTNILALNAAVEAARAGMHGKGFAVVAEEVRSLATRSAEAAKQTDELISSSAVSVAEGSRLVEQVNETLLSVAAIAKHQSGIIDNIQLSSAEQSSAFEQVNVDINQVTKVVQQNSATAEESAAASEEMSAQSSMLQELLSKFRLRGENTPE